MKTAELLKIGLIGLDMSHAVEFTRRLNDPRHAEHVSGGRVVAGWPGGSNDFELSWSRVGKFTAEIRETFGVEILDSPEAVAGRVDVLLITAADGRAHRPLFERIVRFKRPTFIEKPLAMGSYDAQAILRLAADEKIPLLSCSTARFGEPLRRAVEDEGLGKIIGCDVFGPMPEEATQPGLFWYGVHSIEVLNVVMGRGCKEVRAYRNDDFDLVTAVWRDGRVATFRGMRKGEWKFGMTLHRERGFQFVDLQHNSWFKQTLELMLAGLPNGKSPVEAADTLEIIRIIEAANASRASGLTVELPPPKSGSAAKTMIARKLTIFLGILVLAGCARPRAPIAASVVSGGDGDRHPWTHLKFDNDPESFQFAIVGDRTGKHRPGVFEDGLAKLNLLRPEFVMSVGDLIEGYTKDASEIDQQWDEIEGFTAKLDAPFFYVAGNHDLSNPVQAKKWRERFGPAYYHFVYRDVLFLCLSTYDPESRISGEQIAYIERALRSNPKVRHTCVFMHEPLWDYKKETGWSAVEKLLADRPYTVFAGHYHTYTKYVRHDRRYFVLATTGGGLKQGLESPELGAFDHVTWVTMRPDGPLVANVELKGIHDENVRTEAAANLINRVLAGNVLQIAPVLMAGETFDRAATTLTFRNDADVPMTARGSIAGSGPLRATPETFELAVPGGTSRDMPIALSAQTPTAVSALSPLTVKWVTEFPPTTAGGKPVRVPREDVLAAEQLMPCPSRSSALVVDGNLDDWSAFPFNANASDAKDCSYQFAVEHDDQYVYIAVKTTDDKSVLSPLKEPWSQDGVEIRFDARSEPERSQGRGRGEFKDILVISMSPSGDGMREKMVLYSAAQLPKDVKAVCLKTPTGHAAEIAIPASYLDSRQGGAWKRFRMNVVVDDYDTVAGPLKALWWRPDWRSAETFAGSGTFERK